MSSGMERMFDEWREEAEAMNKPQGMKFDSQKPDYSLLPFGPIDEVVKVLTYGANKYNRFNWQYVERHRYEAATMRHLSAYFQGEKQDPETGISHLAHAMCSLIFLMEFDKRESNTSTISVVDTPPMNYNEFDGAPAVYKSSNVCYNNGYSNVTMTLNGMKYETK